MQNLSIEPRSTAFEPERNAVDIEKTTTGAKSTLAPSGWLEALEHRIVKRVRS